MKTIQLAKGGVVHALREKKISGYTKHFYENGSVSEGSRYPEVDIFRTCCSYDDIDLKDSRIIEDKEVTCKLCRKVLHLDPEPPPKCTRYVIFHISTGKYLKDRTWRNRESKYVSEAKFFKNKKVAENMIPNIQVKDSNGEDVKPFKYERSTDYVIKEVCMVVE